MLKINFYCVPGNRKIQSDSFPIYDKVNDAFNHLHQDLSKITEEDIKEKDIQKSLCFRLEAISDPVDRAALNLEAYNSVISFSEKDALCTIQWYFVHPSGQVLLVEDFDKLISRFKDIENVYMNTLKSIVDHGEIKSVREEAEKELANSKTTKDIISANTQLGYIYTAMKGYIDDNESEFQDIVNKEILEVRRREEVNKTAESEYDILIANIDDVTKDEDMEDDEIIACQYNNEDIDYMQLLGILDNHKLPNFFAKFTRIEDTMDDQYYIETKKLIITRSPGGNLRIKRK